MLCKDGRNPTFYEVHQNSILSFPLQTITKDVSRITKYFPNITQLFTGIDSSARNSRFRIMLGYHIHFPTRSYFSNFILFPDDGQKQKKDNSKNVTTAVGDPKRETFCPPENLMSHTCAQGRMLARTESRISDARTSRAQKRRGKKTFESMHSEAYAKRIRKGRGRPFLSPIFAPFAVSPSSSSLRVHT